MVEGESAIESCGDLSEFSFHVCRFALPGSSVTRQTLTRPSPGRHSRVEGQQERVRSLAGPQQRSSLNPQQSL